MNSLWLHGTADTEQCAECQALYAWLCDYPLGDGRTCDRRLCEGHGHVVGHDMHYCETHYRHWHRHNPGETPYLHTHLDRKILPSYTDVALTFLKREFDVRDRLKDRSDQITRLLRNSAIPLGRAAAAVANRRVDEAPHASLAGGLEWGIDHGLIEVCWRRLPGGSPSVRFAMTRDGLAVMEGETVEREPGG